MNFGQFYCAVTLLITLSVATVEPLRLHAQFGQFMPSVQQPRTIFVTNARMNRILKNAEKSMAKHDFSNAVQLLQAILDKPQDSFFSPGESNKFSYRSIKLEALQLLAQLPPQGRRTYELRYGSEARALLNEAFKTNSHILLEEVARRFFHTQAGYEATYRLGTYHLDHSEPLAAASCFDQVRKIANVSRQWEPMLSLKAAVCWGRAGMLEKSIRTLKKLKQTIKDDRITLGGQHIPFFENDERALQRLMAVLGQQQKFASIGLQTWTMFGGCPSRNAPSAEATPVWDFPWSFHTLQRQNSNEPERFAKIETQLKAIETERLAKGFPVISTAHSLIVGDIAVLRSPFDIKAVNVKTGEQIWQSASVDPSFNHLSKQLGSVLTRPGIRQLSSLTSLLKQRVWHDLTAGTLSSNGAYVFTVEELGVQGNTSQSRFQQTSPSAWAARDYNKLMAFELRSQGKMVWEIGGSQNEQLLLAGTFFLGPPLPLGNQLYCLGETNGEICLLAIDPNDKGRLKWSQSLLSLDLLDSVVMTQPLRRMSGISPTYADGVIVCPTMAGAVVAVDLSRRMLLWEYQYHNAYKYDPGTARELALRARLLATKRSTSLNLDNLDYWVDSIPVISDGYVLVTPRDSNELHCVSLIDGALIWKNPRGLGLYLAGVRDGKAIIVGRTQIQALGLADGQPAWKQPTPIPMPSGRGFRTAGRYHLPLSTGEIATINLENGRILASSKLRDGRVPGNLVAAGGTIISQTIDSVVAFKPLESVNKGINNALEKNPDDSEALALRGSVRLHQGNLDRGLVDLYRSIKLNSGKRARRQLVTTLLEGLRLDFSNYRQLAPDIENLLEDPQQRSTYLRVFADGLQKIGKSRAALSEYLKLADLNTGKPTLEKINAAHLVHSDRWVRGRITHLYRESNSQERAELDREIDAQFQRAVDRNQADALKRIIGYFPNHPVAAKARRILVDQLDANSDTLELEFHLLRLSRSSDSSIAGFAIARLASILIAYNRAREAAPFVEMLASKWSAVVCLEEKTGQQLASEWLADETIGTDLTHTILWPNGRIETKHTVKKQRTRTGVYPIQFVGPRGPFFENWSVALDQMRTHLIAHDGYGNQHWKLSINDSGRSVSSTYLASVRAYGHLLVVVIGNQFVVVDGSGKTPKLLWRKNLIEESARPVNGGVRLQFQPPFRNGARRMVVTDHLGRPLGTVGVVTDEFLCYQVGTKLYAADTLTGKTLWIRSNVSAGSDLFGDSEYVFVVAPNSNQAIVFRGSDGEQLGTRPLTKGPLQLTSQGRNLLTWARTNNKQILTHTDVFSGTTIWKKEFADLAKTTIVNGDEISVLEPTGRFTVWDIASGQLRLESQANLERNLLQIVVFRSSDHYLLLTNTSPKDNATRVSPLTFTNPKVNGHAYAFDRQTGQKLWGGVKVKQQAINLHQPQELPILVFACRLYRRVNQGGNNRSRTGYSVLILDRRNGRIILEDPRAPQISWFTVTPNRAERKIDIQYDRANIALTFNDQPITIQPSNPEQKPKYSADR